MTRQDFSGNRPAEQWSKLRQVFYGKAKIDNRTMLAILLRVAVFFRTFYRMSRVFGIAMVTARYIGMVLQHMDSLVPGRDKKYYQQKCCGMSHEGSHLRLSTVLQCLQKPLIINSVLAAEYPSGNSGVFTSTSSRHCTLSHFSQ